MTDTVVHNAARQRFELDVDGQTAFTEYRLSSGAMTFFHTLTPPALRGRGLAARVVQAALEYARAERLKVVRCAGTLADTLERILNFTG